METVNTSTQLPVIDLGAYMANKPGSLELAAKQVREALENVGFFSIVGHGVPWEQVEEIYDWARRYHDLALETKRDHLMSSGNMGYIGIGGAQIRDRAHSLNAAFFMGRPGSKRNQFPSDTILPGFRSAAESYYRTLESLCLKILPLYALAADMAKDYFQSFFSPSLATLRVTHYPDVPAEDDQFGIDTHSDAGFMTLLPTNTVNGLWIESETGWFQVDQEPMSFVVNSGDTLRSWSNNRFRSTRHRALNESGGDRYAIPFFFDPRADTSIEPLSGCVDELNPVTVSAYRYGDYLRTFMQAEYAQTANSSIK